MLNIKTNKNQKKSKTNKNQKKSKTNKNQKANCIYKSFFTCLVLFLINILKIDVFCF